MKDFLKKLLVPILASRQITAVAEKVFDRGIPIFILHRLSQDNNPVAGRISPKHLRKCLNYLVENNYNLISLEHLILALQDKAKIPSKSVVFTMDDGYIDQAEIAAPIFLEYNCPLTFFVITGMLDKNIWPWDAQTSWIIESSNDDSIASSATIKSLGLKFDKKLGKNIFRRSLQDTFKTIDADKISDILMNIAIDVGLTIPVNAPPSHRAMSWDMARNLEKQGICFAPHSINHHILSKLNDESSKQEIEQSWQSICAELKNPLKVFCYPNGKSMDFDNREIAILKKSGYMGAVSVEPGFIKYNDHNTVNHIYSLPRIALPDNMIDFIQYCSWIECAKDLRKIL